MPKQVAFKISVPITVTKAEQRVASGWASVIEEDGEAVVDHHDDTISEAELVEAARDFMLNSRTGKAMHAGRAVASVVESMVFTKDAQKALGIDLERVGWWISMKIHDDKVWKRVKSGELSAFSIGGMAFRSD